MTIVNSTQVTLNAGSSAEPRAAHEPHELPASMIERMTLIIDAFEGRRARLTLREVARRTQLPRSTVHRILDQLVCLGWLEHTAFGYCLGRRTLDFGGQDGGHGEVRAAAAPLLHELYLRTGMVVHLAVLGDGDVVYLDKVGGRFAAALPSRVGGRVPAHSTAVGKAMLAWQEPEAVDTLLDGRLNRRTERTIGDMATLHQELNRVRQRHGLAFERGESCPGVACVGAAVRGHEGSVAGISLSGEEKAAQLERVAPLVIDAARKVSHTLFSPTETPYRSHQSAEAPEHTWSAGAMDQLLATGQGGQWG